VLSVDSFFFYYYYFDILHAKYLSIHIHTYIYIYIKEKYRHLRLFSRSGGGGPLTRKRLFCIIHEFFIRFVHHPPGNCIHTRVHTYYMYIYIYLLCTICTTYVYGVWCIPDRGRRLAPPIYARTLYIIIIYVPYYYIYTQTCRRTHTRRFTRAYYFRPFWREQRSGVNRTSLSVYDDDHNTYAILTYAYTQLCCTKYTCIFEPRLTLYIGRFNGVASEVI